MARKRTPDHRKAVETSKPGAVTKAESGLGKQAVVEPVKKPDGEVVAPAEPVGSGQQPDAAAEDKPLSRAALRSQEIRTSGHRETIESIAVAIILALLFRGFVAEAFVIPTGSMAPALMGEH